jgi:aminopeptidase
MSADPRVEAYASVLVETCLDVQPGWQVIVNGGALARPLIEAASTVIGKRDAWVLQRVSLTGDSINLPWALAAPEGRLSTMAPIDAHAWENADALLSIVAPENTRGLSRLPADRLALIQGATREHYERVFTHDLKWVGCQFPTPALAQEAGMSLQEFEDFLYGACLLDWNTERERMKRYAELFDGAEVVRIVAGDTDLSLGVEGRPTAVDAGGANMPGGEFYCCPLEDSARGTIAFSEFPAVYSGKEVEGIALQFEDGLVTNASATKNEDFLFSMLDLDDGSRRLGELGIGCNPGITRHLKNTAFDEKIDGTVHLALGNGLPNVGGTNVSRLHWDIVKDLRENGRIELDGKVVQENGRWAAA